MEIVAGKNGDVLLLRLKGEIDEYSASAARRIADEIIERNLRVETAVFDLEEVSFMDSTGIGFLIGRYKKLARYSIPVYIKNPTPSTDKILSVSGVYSLIPRI